MASILKRDLARDYALTLSWRYAEVEYLGLPKLKDEVVFRLEHIYVPLRVCRDWSNRFDPQKAAYIPSVLQEHRFLIVLGDPGSGKSTLIKVLTYAFGEADNNAYKRACGELIPIPIILRDYRTREWNSYSDMLGEFINTLAEDIRKEITPEWLLDYLRRGKAILLIDGLDEVGVQEERLRLRDEIILPLLEESLRSRAILTSRIVGYEEVPFDHSKGIVSMFLRRYFVAPFDDDAINQFIIRWYQLRETFPDKQREGAESLMRALTENDRVKRLAHNPQLLTLMALIHRVTANLPSGRVELYDKIVEAYLETIQVYRKLGTPARLDEMKRWLGKIGWKMQVMRDEYLVQNPSLRRTDELVVSRQNIKEWLVEAVAIERGSAGAQEVADQFLDYVAKRSGLLVPSGPETFSFAHLTFQEYFAAFELRGQIRQFQRLGEICADLATRLHWHETLNLLFEMLTEFPGASDDLFDQILAKSKGAGKLRSNPTKLFSALLRDEQSGLSEPKQRDATGIALTVICNDYDETIIENLQSLSHLQQQEMIRPWFVNRLREIKQLEPGKYFFLIGDELLGDWPQQLEQWLFSQFYSEPDELQLAEIVLIGAHDKKTFTRISSWASSRLPLKQWLRRISRSYGHGGGLTLADIYRSTFYSFEADEPRSKLLLEMSIALAITRSQFLRISLALITGTIPYKYSPYYRDHQRTGYLGSVDDHDLNEALRRAVPKALSRVPARDLARDLACDLAVDGSHRAERKLASLLTREKIERRNVPLSMDVANQRRGLLRLAEEALFTPDVPIENLSAELRRMLQEQDQWSQLLASSALLMLGEGTPDLCRRRNALLTEGLRSKGTFTFPTELQAETQDYEFCEQLPELFELIFLQSYRRTWLRPEFFDHKRPFATYFLSKPQAFLDFATQVLERQPDQ